MTANLLINMIPALTGGITALITLFVMRMRQDKRNYVTLVEFSKKITPEEEWPEHWKPKDPEMEEILRLRRALEEEQQ
jgi:hypothetical protein